MRRNGEAGGRVFTAADLPRITPIREAAQDLVAARDALSAIGAEGNETPITAERVLAAIRKAGPPGGSET